MERTWIWELDKIIIDSPLRVNNILGNVFLIFEIDKITNYRIVLTHWIKDQNWTKNDNPSPQKYK